MGDGPGQGFQLVEVDARHDLDAPVLQQGALIPAKGYGADRIQFGIQNATAAIQMPQSPGTGAKGCGIHLEA